MTYPLLMNSKKIVMLIRGEEKKKVLIDSLTKKLPVSILIPKLDLILN
jgi:6-phosphogluconolactonase/glucosamine-6-phosphate isomerase/deaminase